MKKNLVVDGMGKVTITDKNFLGAGGQADVYSSSGKALKIYHDASKMIPMDKFKELNAINSNNVLKPLGVIWENNVPVGYSMDLMSGCDPICLLFTKAYMQSNNIDSGEVTAFVGKMHDVVKKVHEANCLIVDLNEMNVLFGGPANMNPHFIDVDSYQTPTYKATAIMDSIRDRKVVNQQWTKMSDWYSFGILAFQMYVNMHPYKGTHPDFSPKDWSERMDKGISCLDKKASLPRFCNPLSNVPPAFLEWFKYIFVENKRSEPPSINSMGVLTIPVNMNIVRDVSAMFTVNIAFTMPEVIKSVFSCIGVEYFVCKNHVYMRNGSPLIVDISGATKVLLCDSGDTPPIIAVLKNNIASFFMLNGAKIGEISAMNMMYRNGCIYTHFNGKMTENTFTKIGVKILHGVRQACDILDNTIRCYDGVMFQNLLGNIFIALPYQNGAVAMYAIPELKGHKVLDAYSAKNICIVIAEKGGEYHRFYFTFEQNWQKYSVRIVNNVDFCTINCAVLDTGVAVLATLDEIELFKGNDGKNVNNPPFDASNKLFNINSTLYFVDGNNLKSVKNK